MSQPTVEDARTLSEWAPRLGVVSVYLRFDPGDRGGAWRTELRNGLDRLLGAAKQAEHGRRVALRETARRLAERFEDGELRPPPRGEAGFVEVAEKEGPERWWGTGVPPLAPECVQLGERPAVAPLVELSCQAEPRGVALLSAERVRLLRFADGALAELEDWELSVFSLDWRERKARSTADPARAQGVSSSGRDQFGERLDHNRQRFLTECGRLAGQRLDDGRLGEVVVFGPARDVEGFNAGLTSPSVSLELGGEEELISTPTGRLVERVGQAVEALCARRDRELVERALEEARGGSRGAAGVQEVGETLAEGRVESLVLDAGLEEKEALVRAALTGGAKVSIVRDEVAALLAPADGAAAILRY
jgi:Bacterial archaeo-eukaryotic release factor family 10